METARHSVKSREVSTEDSVCVCAVHTCDNNVTRLMKPSASLEAYSVFSHIYTINNIYRIIQ